MNYYGITWHKYDLNQNTHYLLSYFTLCTTINDTLFIMINKFSIGFDDDVIEIDVV